MTTEPHAPRGRFPVGLTVAVAIAFAILVALGTWQVQRLHWKEGLLAQIGGLKMSSAQPLAPVLARAARGGKVEYTRVTVTCDHIATAPFLELYSILDGRVGVRLISACAVEDGPYRSILVDRGFIPDSTSARPRVEPAPRPDPGAALTVVGVLRDPEHGNLFSPKNLPGAWYIRDAPAMARALRAPAPAPLFLLVERTTNPEFTALVPAPTPTDIPNNHFEYALTWYGLAAALLGVYAAMLLRAFGPRKQQT